MKKKELYKQLGIKYSFYTVFFKRFLGGDIHGNHDKKRKTAYGTIMECG